MIARHAQDQEEIDALSVKCRQLNQELLQSKDLLFRGERDLGQANTQIV